MLIKWGKKLRFSVWRFPRARSIVIRPKFGMSAGLLPIFLLAASSPAMASNAAANNARTSLSSMAGKWRGSGWGVRHKGAPRERVRCRMTAKYRNRSRKLVLSGKCAAVSRSFTLLGHIAEYTDSNHITGRWINPDGLGALNIKGVRRGNHFIFDFRARDRKAKTKLKYRTVWAMKAKSILLSTVLPDDKGIKIGELSFAR